MTFENDYNKLVKVAKDKIRLYKIDVDPSEILSDLYIKHFSIPDFKYSIEFFEKEIYHYCGNYKNTKAIFVPLGKVNDRETLFIAECTCSVCKAIKPAACFPIITFKNGRKFQQIRCEDCIKTDNHKNFRTYFKKNKDKWNEYLRKRHQEAKEQLTDVYIRRLLRAKYTTTHLLKNPHLITQKRKELLKKRDTQKENSLKII